MRHSTASARRLLCRWIAGLFVGTLLVWCTSPWFIRSYHSRVFDPICRDWVYPIETAYRWRSEGYATTVFGPHAMAGRTTLPTKNPARTIALWGDSQAEGVCVADDEKLWAVLESRLNSASDAGAAVLPMAHSGEDAVDWTSRFARTESDLSVDEHFLLACELEDLRPLAAPLPDRCPVNDSLSARKDRKWLDWLPDFLIHAGRGILLNSQGAALRELRFGLGPMAVNESFSHQSPASDQQISWFSVAQRLRSATSKPITVIYAPRLPAVVGGRVIWEDSSASEFQSLAVCLRQRGIGVVDCRDAFRSTGEQNRFSHGFHNGVIGNGHLNASGYQVIARVVMAKERWP